jgi:nucleoside-diphosphate-sugar epimerase
VRALVVGATGFIGSNLVRELLASKVETWGTVREDSQGRWRLRDVTDLQELRIPSYATDELERAVEGLTVDVVYDAAGAGTSHTERRSEALLDGNVRLAVDVARLAARTARRLVHLGTCSEYAPKPLAAGALREDDPISPTSEYGASKIAGETRVAEVCRAAGLERVHVRLFNTYGPFEADERLIPYLTRRLLDGGDAALTTGTQVRDFTFVADTCRALRLLADVQLANDEGAFNLCTGIGTRVADVVSTVADVLGVPRQRLRFGVKPQRADEPAEIVGDNSRIRRATGWTPDTELRSGIERSVAEARERNTKT